MRGEERGEERRGERREQQLSVHLTSSNHHKPSQTACSQPSQPQSLCTVSVDGTPSSSPLMKSHAARVVLPRAMSRCTYSITMYIYASCVHSVIMFLFLLLLLSSCVVR